MTVIHMHVAGKSGVNHGIYIYRNFPAVKEQEISLEENMSNKT